MKRLALLALLGLLTTHLHAQPFGKLVRKTPGVVSYTFRDSFAKDVPATLDKIKGMGLTDIELSNLFGQTAPAMRALLDQRGMRCSSYGVNYDDIVQKPDSVLMRAKTLGAQYVRVAWIPHDGDLSVERADQAIRDFNAFGQRAKAQGLMFCYHNHGYEFHPYQNGTLFDYIVAKTNPDYVNFEMDIAWTYLPGQNPAALLAKYPKRFRLMHLKDVKKGVASNDKGKLAPENSIVLGTGQLDLPAILKAARAAGVDHLYIEDESPAADTQVPQSITYLRQL